MFTWSVICNFNIQIQCSCFRSQVNGISEAKQSIYSVLRWFVHQHVISLMRDGSQLLTSPAKAAGLAVVFQPPMYFIALLSLIFNFFIAQCTAYICVVLHVQYMYVYVCSTACTLCIAVCSTACTLCIYLCVLLHIWYLDWRSISLDPHQKYEYIINKFHWQNKNTQNYTWIFLLSIHERDSPISLQRDSHTHSHTHIYICIYKYMV